MRTNRNGQYMPRARNVVLSIALIAAVFTGYLLVKRNDSPVRDQGGETADQAATRENVADPRKPFAQMYANGEAPDSAVRPQDDGTDCISPAQLESDPVLTAEYARFDSLVTSGPTIESYRGLPSAQLENLAIQGDSAATAVLGAISVMRAMNLNEDQAVAYLLLEEPGLQSFGFEQPLEPETAKHLEDASDWFYKAAVHGRLLALQNVGEIIAIIGGSPTELGWISQGEYDSLEAYERHALDATNVYAALAFEIAPELRTGPLGTMISDLTPGGERQQLVLNELAWRFKQDREAAGLPPIEISESTAPSMEELESMLCEP